MKNNRDVKKIILASEKGVFFEEKQIFFDNLTTAHTKNLRKRV